MLAFYKKEKEKKKNVHHWPLYLAAVFFILADIAVASYFIFEEYYQNKIYPGISLGEINLAGKTAEEALALKKELKQIASDEASMRAGAFASIVVNVFSNVFNVMIFCRL